MYDTCGHCGSKLRRRWFYHQRARKKKLGWRCIKNGCPGAYIVSDSTIYAVPLTKAETAQQELPLMEQNYVLG